MTTVGIDTHQRISSRRICIVVDNRFTQPAGWPPMGGQRTPTMLAITGVVAERIAVFSTPAVQGTSGQNGLYRHAKLPHICNKANEGSVPGIKRWMRFGMRLITVKTAGSFSDAGGIQQESAAPDTARSGSARYPVPDLNSGWGRNTGRSGIGPENTTCRRARPGKGWGAKAHKGWRVGTRFNGATLAPFVNLLPPSTRKPRC